MADQPRRRRRRPYVRLRVLSWNVWVGNRAIRAALLLLAALFRPHVICLQEARRFTGTIPGYRRLAADTSRRRHATNCVTLVRRGLRLAGHGPEYVAGDGWAYEGNPKPARTFYGAVARKGGLDWAILNVHRCVGGPRGNSPAEWREEDRTIAAWAARHDGPACIVGDHNDSYDQADHQRDRTTADLADRIDAQVLTPGGICYALVRRCGGRIRRLARKFGSDTHAPVVVDLKAHRPAPLQHRLITERINTERSIPLP